LQAAVAALDDAAQPNIRFDNQFAKRFQFSASRIQSLPHLAKGTPTVQDSIEAAPDFPLHRHQPIQIFHSDVYARPRVIRGTRVKPLPLLPSGPGGVRSRPLHEARSLTNPIVAVVARDV
jgi:hypothetical protein